jgi:hypothetical protein
VDTNHTEWDCTALCGSLSGDGECSDVSGFVEMGSDHVKGGEMPGLSSAGRVKLSGHFGERILAVLAVAVGVCVLF